MASISSSSELLNEEIEIQSMQKSFLKSAKKSNYGSMRKDESQAIMPIVNYKYKLKPGDTLQGISLKFNVPIENIKRTNRLWSNDLALVKDVLIVPLRKDKFDELKVNSPDLVVDENDGVNKPETVSNAATNQKPPPPPDELADYLTKFDCLITESKMRLKHLENSSNLSQGNTSTPYKTYTDSNNESLNTMRHNKSFSSLNKSSKSSNTDSADSSSLATNKLENSLTSMPECLFADPAVNNSNDTSASSSNSNYMNGSGGAYGGSRAKFAHKNLLRLEREKDELFEL